jgi:AmiR/NasT family two-component response regulator
MASTAQRAIRVLVANRPRLLRELVLTTLSEQPDIEVVGEAADELEIPALIERTHPDFLFIAQDEPRRRPPLCDVLLRQHPQLRIIAVAPNQSRSVHYWASFDIHSGDIETSEEGILGAVRGRTRLTNGGW